MAETELPPAMVFAAPVLNLFNHLAREFDLSRQEAALLFAREAWPKAEIVFGAETVAQVEDNIAVWNRESPGDLVPRIRETFQSVDEQLLDPSRWPAG